MEPIISQHKLERLEYFLRGDKQALLFCLDLLYIAHLWDDLIDKDKERSGEDISQAFIKSLAGIPSNPFYQRCAPALLPMMYNSLLLWLESNELRKGGVDDKVTAFTIMHSVVEVIHFCIVVKGEADWARENAKEFWALFGVNKTELDECLEAEDV